MNILYVFATLPIGGAEEHLRTIVNGLDPKHYSSLVCCVGEKGVLGAEMERDGVEVVSLDRMKTKRWEPGVVRALAALIRERDIDIVHTHLYHANMYGRLAAFVAGVPVVSTEHNVYQSYKQKRSIINRLLARKTDRLIAVSGAVKDYVVERDSIDPENIEVVHNGIDIERYSLDIDKAGAREKLGLSGVEGPVIGTVSRLAKQKGHSLLLKAFKGLTGEFPGIRLLIAGSGPLEGELKEEAAALDLDAYVSFLGVRRDVPVMLRALDLYVLPSFWEGFPLALLEAMASGTPVLATNVGGVSEVVKDKVTGTVIEPGDIDKLGAAIRGVLSDSEGAKTMAEAGRRIVKERFSTEAMVKSLTRIYDEVVAKKAKVAENG